MFRLRVSIVLVILTAVSAGHVRAADVQWQGAVSRSWSEPGNWAGGNLPTNADRAILFAEPGPLIDSSTVASCQAISLGGSAGGGLHVDGGTLSTTTSWIILGYSAGANGTMTIDSGTVTAGTTMYVGFQGSGTLTMNGGTLNVNGARFGIARDSAASVGRVYLNGGVINCLDFTMATVAGSTASLDLAGGKLVINGDKTTTINTYIANGWITAYGGVGALNVDYNVSTPSKTTVTGFMESAVPTKATSPTPANGATNVSVNATLSWSAGVGATSHDVYFGTTSPGAFQGNQTGATFNPGPLDSDTVYYWRIDGKNDIGTTTGDVWSFTTSSPMDRQPINVHLSWNENAVGSTMLVKWATLAEAESIVRYGTTDSYDHQQIGSSVWSSACGQYIHTVQLTGLTAGTPYHYSCGSPAGWSDDAVFYTGLDAGDRSEFVFVLGGDSRNPNDTTPNPTYAVRRKAVMNAIMLEQPRFFIHLGDIPNRGRYQEQWDEIFADTQPMFAALPYMISWGSHEDPEIAPNAFTQFDFPPNGTPADQDKYYSFDYGNVHFTVLYVIAAAAHEPRVVPGSAQYNWLVDDLEQAVANPDIDWIVVAIHAPPYSTAIRSAGGSCLALREDISPLIDQYGVDVVFTAHEHNFERTHLIQNVDKVMDVPNGAVLENPEGTLYYVSGGLGAGINSADGNAWFSAIHQNVMHFLRVQVAGNTLNIKAIQSNGALLDEITIQKHSYLDGDFDRDGQVDTRDLAEFTEHWLQTGRWP